METILGLLIVVLPLVFKLVEKRLQASGRQQDAETVQEWIEMFDAADEDVQEKTEPAQQISVPEKPKPIFVEAPRVVTPKQTAKPKKPARQILVEEEPKKKEKIDPKKLVIYSEIMKPKY